MKDFKDYIEENRDLFDDREPMAGHFERFGALLDEHDKKEKLNVSRKSAKRISLIRVISVAASIIILIGVAVHFYTPNQIVPTDATIENNDDKPIVSEEFRTTNEYYNQQMNQQISDIMCKLAYTDSENQAQLTKDLQRIIDSNKDFVKDIADNEDEELAIHFLVKHYEANIQALENINEKLGKYTKC